MQVITRRTWWMRLMGLLVPAVALRAQQDSSFFHHNPSPEDYLRDYKLLTIQGQSCFPLYGASGGLTSRMIAYVGDRFPTDGRDLGRHGLHEGADARWYAIEFQQMNELPGMIREAVAALAASRVPDLDPNEAAALKDKFGRWYLTK